MTSPLAGLVVLELASVLAGPSVGQFFAELGADVIKVENVRTNGDVTRRWRLPSEITSDSRSSYFACCNWGKRSIALDLQHPDGQALMHRLAARADVMLTSFRPGTDARLGVDIATLHRLNARLIIGRLTGYGPANPRAGYDAVVQAESGFMAINGQPDGPPTKLPVALMDVLAAHQLKEGLLLALLQRGRTGEGTVVEVSLVQAAVSALANQATNWLVGGTVPARIGSAHPNIAPYGTLYPTADGSSIVLAVGTDRQFARLCSVLGLDALPADARFATNSARVRHREALDALLGARTQTQSRSELLAALHEQHVPAGAVNRMPEVFAQAAASTLVLDGPWAGVRQAVFADPPADLRPPPPYAADTAHVLRDLGCTPADLNRLVEAGVAVVRDA